MPSLNPDLLAGKPEILKLLPLLDAKEPSLIAQRDHLLQQLLPKIKRYRVLQLQFHVKDVMYHARDGYQLVSRLYWPDGLTHYKQPLILYIHGGGLISGTVNQDDQGARDYASLANTPLLSLDYRLAPDNNNVDDLVTDALAGLQWVIKHQVELGIDINKIQIVGVSAGGCLAAGLIPFAYEHHWSIAQLMLIYPMLDDATILNQPELTGLITWTPQMNAMGWKGLLKDRIGDETLPSSVVPMHTQDYTIFPRTYIEVGDCDIFAKEDQIFASNLSQAGVNCQLYVYEGLPHAFETFGVAPYLSSIYANRQSWLLQNK
ncbi:alpha/beta hydrolase [Periweissella fabalis]|uniref:Alpha/beta hydrolase n=1 Tax=Periweissella fabalis TaxID=1070421 RepID=A0A7X6N2T6_9LACO|nr:alpha/beta hydrolase [Periweissella fabalis]MCM0599388.1 alpha/beta hydrolase [Periweissella fabalis]NKZ23667.1 alpha/beta hydrolase [Periweissella fabalis]